MSLVYFPIEYCPGDGDIPPANPPGVALGVTHWVAAPALGGRLFLVCTGDPPGYVLEASFTLPACPDCVTASEILEGNGPMTTTLTLTEAEFMEKVITRAQARQWMVHHCRPCRRADGTWYTPVQGHAGYPDLTLARDGVVLFAELKTQAGRLRPEQQRWLEILDGEVWRPNDWPEVEAIIDAPTEARR